MTTIWEWCMGEVPVEDGGSPRRRRPVTISIHHTERMAQRALTDLLGGTSSEGYHVVETNDGWAVIRER